MNGSLYRERLNGMSDQQLLREYVDDGSERAFQSLVQRHVDLVYSTALRRLSDAGYAEEVTQNVFVALARKAPFLGRDVALAAWLHKTTLLETRHRLRTELRRKRREEAAIAIGVTMNADDSLLKSLSPVLDEALMDLREKDRHAVLLRFFENKSLREVGEALGVGEDAAQKRVAKSLDQLTRFFRRRGYPVSAATVMAAALHGATQAAPAGLASLAAQSALQSAGAGSLAGIGLVIAKIMSLTKTQTVALCLLVSALPIAYEGSALSQGRADRKTLQARLEQVEQSLLQFDQSRRDAEERLARAGRSLDLLRVEAARQHVLLAEARTNFYVWSDRSEYVRIPKTLASSLVLSESRIEEFSDGNRQRTQTPVLSDDGALSPVMAEVLAATPGEAARVKEDFQEFARDFRALEQTRVFETNHPPTAYGTGLPNSRTLVTGAFPSEGAAVRDQLRARWNGALGDERAAVLWQQTGSYFDDNFNSFGGKEKFETVFWGDDRVGYGRAFRDPESASFGNSSTTVSGPWEAVIRDVPEHLRAYLPAAPISGTNHGDTP